MIDKYPNLLLDPIPLQLFLSMVASFQTTFFLKLGSYGIWKQVTQVKLMKGSPKVNSVLQFLCLK